jgi:hypothetical protein
MTIDINRLNGNALSYSVCVDDKKFGRGSSRQATGACDTRGLGDLLNSGALHFN